VFPSAHRTHRTRMSGLFDVTSHNLVRQGYLPLGAPPNLALERAVLAYASPMDERVPGGRSADLGFGIALGEASDSEVPVWDAGSGERRLARVDAPIVIYGWVHGGALELLRAGTGPNAVELLRRIGYGAATRSVFLRAGFRDIALDLDPHEVTAVRLHLGSAGVLRVHLDYGMGLLVAQTPRPEPDPALRLALSEAFPGWPLQFAAGLPDPGLGAWQIQIPALPDPMSLRRGMSAIRQGLLRLMARHEPARYRAVCDTLQGFGERDLLKQVARSGLSSQQAAQERVH
jgi:hypothetical protein